MLLASFHVSRVSVMPFRPLSFAPFVGVLFFVSSAFAEERSVEEFAEYSARRIGKSDLALIT